jgi:FtsP/CotA-like multicopper oxidase with cupredoxin domain
MDRAYYPLIAVAALGLALIVAVALFLVLPIQPPYTPPKSAASLDQGPTVHIVLYAGEISNSQYGFGTEANNLTTPGPTLRFRTVDIVNLTVVNVGTKPHAFQVTNAPQAGAATVFKVNIASEASPLLPGQSSSIVFIPSSPGYFYYICPMSGQTEMGMWGTVVVAKG